MDTPPPILDSAKVLAYATVDHTVIRIPKDWLYVDGKPLGPVPKLAICQYPISSEHLLFYCDDDWEVLGCAGYDSLADAKERAEREYRGIGSKWQAYVHEDEAAVDRLCLEPWCSFCGKSFLELDRMVVGKNAFICEECVRNLARSLDVSA